MGPTRELLATQGLELTYNARGALLTAFEEIRASVPKGGPTTILMPAFHCPSAVTPALMAGLKPLFYRIRPDLSIDWEDVNNKTTDATAAILLIHFFGVAPDLTSLASIRGRGVRVVEDCSHAFVSANPLALAGHADSDYRVFSFWKLTPSGVGGGLLRTKSTTAHQIRRLQAPLRDRLRNYKTLLEEAVQERPFLGLRAGFNTIERARNAFKVHRAETESGSVSMESGEAYYPVHFSLARAAMPAHVRRVIESCDLNEISLRRRANFSRYSDQLDKLAPMKPLIPKLDQTTCPWVYPVLLPNRDALDRKLREAGMALHTFGIYLHSKLFESTDLKTIADAKFLAQNTLCLAIHQGITLAQIDRGCLAAQRLLSSH